MTTYRIQEWPDMPGDGEGDAIIFGDGWPDVYERHKSWEEAWQWLAGNAESDDVVVVLESQDGHRDDAIYTAGSF